jgi:hypothetical protein
VIKALNKIAFIVHTPMMLVHYCDVWRLLGKENFVVITTNDFYRDSNGIKKPGVSEFLKYAKTENIEILKISEVITQGLQYQNVVTNHVISGNKSNTSSELRYYLKILLNRALKVLRIDKQIEINSNVYLPLLVGKTQIRFMYGADISDSWSLQSWNKIYDVILCHGVNDEREVKKRFDAKTYVMGYPRYDRYFSGSIDKTIISNEFNIDQSKKTIVWMPTLGGEYSTIPLFVKAFTSFRDKYNFIVRPHPLSFIQEIQYIELLKKYNYQIDKNPLRDMNELYSIADVILADYGGTPFSAIFLGVNLVLLDVKGADSYSFNINSSTLELRQYLPVFNNQNIRELIDLLDSDEFYLSNKNIVNTLFNKYFDSPRGGGARRAANILLNLL